MILVLDIGNSDITIGLFDQQALKYTWRIPAVADRPELYYGIKFRDYLLEAGLSISNVEKIVLSSVVPNLTDKIINVTVTLFEKNPIVLGPDIYKKLPIEVLNPYEIGSDLVANAVAAHTLFKTNCVVVDFGTALTFTTVSGEGKILGVAIAPGLKTAIRALSQNTAKLFEVPLELPKSVLGKNTVHAIQAGILLGYEGLVKSMLERIRAELNDSNLSTVATGGLSSVITPASNGTFTRIEPNLTLEGLRLVAGCV
ncbi:MAG: type III pantothenate kinase [Cyclobacteriaceae bacterium]|nr:type III pantothenate kinase [Cyclobacteriaceae bacterium]MBX2955126.1 type III pantothenate kinase [Cyclobacteriaceae bacterium]